MTTQSRKLLISQRIFNQISSSFQSYHALFVQGPTRTNKNIKITIACHNKANKKHSTHLKRRIRLCNFSFVSSLCPVDRPHVNIWIIYVTSDSPLSNISGKHDLNRQCKVISYILIYCLRYCPMSKVQFSGSVERVCKRRNVSLLMRGRALSTDLDALSLKTFTAFYHLLLHSRLWVNSFLLCIIVCNSHGDKRDQCTTMFGIFVKNLLI